MAKKKINRQNAHKKASLARTPARVETMTDLLMARDAIALTVDGLMEGLQAYRSFATGDGQSQSEPDYATRLKTQQLILEHLVGCPPKRTQVLHGVMPSDPLIDRGQLIKSIDEKIAAMVNRPDVTVSELLQAKRSLVEAEKDAPMKKLSEAELVAEAKRIHGMAEPLPSEPQTQTESTSK